MKLPERLPDHDVAIVVASDSDECRGALRIIDRAAAGWPRPLLNPPHLVVNLDRDKLHQLLHGIEGLDIPATVNVTRGQLLDVAASKLSLSEVSLQVEFPLIVRPRGSHAGVGLAKIDDCNAINRYLEERPEQDYFVSRFVDYASEDRLFRKCRVVFVEGRPYACHMGIADRWDIWYLNAGMSESAAKRLEEETFMRTFDVGFARRHQTALAEMAARIGLDYFTIDCAENQRGELLVFEADNTAVVHNMDSPFVFPYKHLQMRIIFEAFAAMLHRRSRGGRREQAA
jgi:glutathione synthase/RimK-type ligase-like ATP-grasp enzyme